jgi:hypothetical protein
MKAFWLKATVAGWVALFGMPKPSSAEDAEPSTQKCSMGRVQYLRCVSPIPPKFEVCAVDLDANAKNTIDDAGRFLKRFLAMEKRIEHLRAPSTEPPSTTLSSKSGLVTRAIEDATIVPSDSFTQTRAELRKLVATYQQVEKSSKKLPTRAETIVPSEWSLRISLFNAQARVKFFQCVAKFAPG